MLNLDLIHTVAFAGVILFVGYGLCRLIRPLSRYNIPPPVVGGMIIAVVVLIARKYGVTIFKFDITLRDPLMIAFFTTIGFSASLSLLKIGGPQVLKFFIIATVAAVFQNILGILIALPFGLHPLFGVLSGSVTLTGGPATGLAFAPLFEQAGVKGAASIAIAAAMFGIICGGLIGGPIGTFLIDRHKLKKPRDRAKEIPLGGKEKIVEEKVPGSEEGLVDEDKAGYILLKNIVVLLVAMWIGSWVSKGFSALHFTLPAYIGAMFVAAMIRNFDDLTRLIGISQKTMDDLGHISLSLFLVIALMTLKLWELAGLVLPLFLVLCGQALLIAIFCLWPIMKIMGRDYETAVMSSGFYGFMMGTTANAMASMKVLVDKYGRAPRAFLVVSMVGAFFIDFTNALIITVFLNIFK